MLQGLAQILENLITDLSFRRIIIYGILGIMFFGIIFFYEQYSGQVKLTRLERTTELLDKLNSLQDSKKLKEDKELQQIYAEIKSELLILTKQGQIINVPPLFWRGLLSGSIWILWAISTIPGIIRKEKGKVAEFGGAIVIAIFVAIIGILLPNSWNKYILYLIYPLGQFIVLVIFAYLLQWKKK